jgi:glyoxylase-like metal-dependent hydrolase (beta-lactamase superfamily II)
LNQRAQLLPEIAVSIGRDVQRVIAGNAGMMTGPGTNSYVVGARDRIVIDPGPELEAHLQALLEAADHNIRFIVVTHTHKDHSPLAQKLAKLSAATLIGMPPPADGRQDESFVPQQVPKDGEVLKLGEEELIAIHTPGHASNCVCYLLARERLLFTGDHVLEGVSPVILPPDGDMSAYFASLDKLNAYQFERIAPGHGEVMGRGPRVIAMLRAHRQARENKVLACLDALGQATLDTLTPPVYDDVPKDRHAWARLTLEAHLIKLKGEGRVLLEGDAWRLNRA